MRAKKRLGQNFLVDESIAGRIVRELQPRADETIIEIGAGQGALTARLVESAGRLIAIEFDRDLVPALRGRFAARENFELISADALDIDYCSVIAPDIAARVVANLPYNISTAILQRLIEYRHCITEMVLMLQREVVERIAAPAGSSERGFLSVFIEAHCEVEKLFDVPPDAFRPIPKIWSAVACLRMHERIPVEVGDSKLLWQVVSAGFAQRRKTIYNNLRAAPEGLRAFIEAAGGSAMLLEAAGVEPSRRAETLTLQEWSALARNLQPPPVEHADAVE